MWILRSGILLVIVSLGIGVVRGVDGLKILAGMIVLLVVATFGSLLYILFLYRRWGTKNTIQTDEERAQEYSQREATAASVVADIRGEEEEEEEEESDSSYTLSDLDSDPDEEEPDEEEPDEEEPDEEEPDEEEPDEDDPEEDDPEEDDPEEDDPEEDEESEEEDPGEEEDYTPSDNETTYEEEYLTGDGEEEAVEEAER